MAGTYLRLPGHGNWKHGHTAAGGVATREYRAWSSAKRRCYDPKNKFFWNYGGRGIRMCDEWREDFLVFLRDMGACPDGLTLDRLNGDGNYEPGNCRWATRLEQQRNTRRNRMLTLNGETLCVTAWAERLGIDHEVIRGRLRLGWSDHKILTRPVGPRFGFGRK